MESMAYGDKNPSKFSLFVRNLSFSHFVQVELKYSIIKFVIVCSSTYWKKHFNLELLSPWVVSNKAKGWISKRVFQEKKARQIFRKMNIYYSRLCPRTCAC